MLKRGEADIVYLLQGELAEEVQRTPGLTLKPTPIVSTHWLVFADQWDPKSPWADRRVRLAANHAIDRQAINEALTLGFSQITCSIIPQSFDFFWQPPAYAFDPARAKQLLAEAGYPNGFDAGDLWCDAATVTISEALISYLQAVGIRVKLRPLERAAFFKSYQEKKLKNLVYSLSGAFGNAATRLETFTASGGPYVYGRLSRHRRALPRAGGDFDRKRREAPPPHPAADPRQGDVRADLAARLHPCLRPSGGGVRPRAHHRLGILRALRGREAEGEVREVRMDEHRTERRDFLKRMTALGAAGVPIVAGLRSALAQTGHGPGGSPMKTAYDPAGKFEIKVSEVDFGARRLGGSSWPAISRKVQGRSRGARLARRRLEPQGPFGRGAHGPRHRGQRRPGGGHRPEALAEAPYPASVQDASYGVRWLKSKAAEWNGDPSKIGMYGSSSGGHVAQLLGLRPRDRATTRSPCPRPRTSMRRWPTWRPVRRSATRTRASSRRSG